MHIIRGIRARGVVSVMLTLLVASAGCGPRGKGSSPALPGPPAPLVIRNHSYFDVNVYVVLASVQSRSRLATVSGHSELRVDIPERNLKPGRILALYVHAIGSSGSWVSPELPMMSESVACLDVMSDPYGNLSRSQLYSVPMMVVDADTLVSPSDAGDPRKAPSRPARVVGCGG